MQALHSVGLCLMKGLLSKTMKNTQEHPAACYHYGDLYYMIEYYPKDIEQAMYWWEKAAAKGEQRAKNRLLWIKANNKFPLPTNMNNDQKQ